MLWDRRASSPNGCYYPCLGKIGNRRRKPYPEESRSKRAMGPHKLRELVCNHNDWNIPLFLENPGVLRIEATAHPEPEEGCSQTSYPRAWNPR